MQIPKRHLPVVGLIGLVVIASAGGTVVYFQFLHPPNTSCGVPSHRLIFMTAAIEELGGFQIVNGAFLNQTTAPGFNATGPSLVGVKHQNYTAPSDHKTISAIVGDTVTLYIRGINASFDQRQYPGIAGHGFDITPLPTVTSGGLHGTIPLGGWYTVTFVVTATGTYFYSCWIPCSNGHGNMNGNMVVSCG